MRSVKEFRIGDYLFQAYINWAGPNFLPLVVYEDIRLTCNLAWSVVLEFKSDEVIVWNRFEGKPVYEFEYNADNNNTHIIGEDQQNNIWVGIEKLSPNNDFFKKVYPLIEPELQNIRADIIMR